jgi:hypothetical protein
MENSWSVEKLHELSEGLKIWGEGQFEAIKRWKPNVFCGDSIEGMKAVWKSEQAEMARVEAMAETLAQSNKSSNSNITSKPAAAKSSKPGKKYPAEKGTARQMEPAGMSRMEKRALEVAINASMADAPKVDEKAADKSGKKTQLSSRPLRSCTQVVSPKEVVENSPSLHPSRSSTRVAASTKDRATKRDGVQFPVPNTVVPAPRSKLSLCRNRKNEVSVAKDLPPSRRSSPRVSPGRKCRDNKMLNMREPAKKVRGLVGGMGWEGWDGDGGGLWGGDAGMLLSELHAGNIRLHYINKK